MVDINRHKFFLVQILKDIYSDLELANILGLKGGTALMFFYDLPRFSVDLDFNLLVLGDFWSGIKPLHSRAQATKLTEHRTFYG